MRRRSCHSPVTEAARFCSQCGQPLESETGSVGGAQRRWITVLFCDVVDSTALSRRMDPEEYGECMLAYQKLAHDVVERHGGHVANYLGDGVLAFFGWPTSHERDTDLAIRAARELHARLLDLRGELQRAHGF